jgi:gluconolactonase
MKAFILGCAALVSGSVFLAGSAQSAQSGATTRVDPAFDAIVSTGTAMDTVKSGFGFINGIVWVREPGGGHLLISDIPANVVHKWTPDGNMSAFLEKPDWARTTNRPANPRFGANGITIDPQGRVVYAAEADRAIVRLEKDGKRTILAERFEGQRLNSPNDLVFRSDGALYFTDPSGGNRFADWDLKKELPFQGVFLLKDGKLQPVVKDLERPNGIVLSPD